MAYGGIMFYNLHMPLYILGTFTEYPYLKRAVSNSVLSNDTALFNLLGCSNFKL